MIRIVISGYYGSRNAGDEAMLYSMLLSLNNAVKDLSNEKLHITILSADPAETKSKHQHSFERIEIDSVSWMNPFLVAFAIARSDLFISGGGSLLQNVTSKRSLYYYLAVIFLALFFRRKTMLYAQGIGPVEGNFPRTVLKNIINHVDLITTRDEGSLAELKNLGIDKPRIFSTADPVLALSSIDLERGYKILRPYIGRSKRRSEPLIGLAVREWRGWTDYKRSFALAVVRLVEELGAKIVFIPMQYPEDVKAARTVAQMSKKFSDGFIDEDSFAVLNSQYSTTDLLSIVGCLDVLVSIRLHALIFAGVMGIPIVGVSYDPKIDRYLDSIEEKPVANLDSLTADDIVDAVTSKLRRGFSNKTKETLKNLRTRAEENSKLALSLINFDRR